jgi:rubredoxin
LILAVEFAFLEVEPRVVLSAGFFLLDMMATDAAMKTWMCLICGWIYDEAAGVPDAGVAAGTRWEDIPPNWTCPECGARKEDFEMVEI